MSDTATTSAPVVSSKKASKPSYTEFPVASALVVEGESKNVNGTLSKFYVLQNPDGSARSGLWMHAGGMKDNQVEATVKEFEGKDDQCVAILPVGENRLPVKFRRSTAIETALLTAIGQPVAKAGRKNRE